METAAIFFMFSLLLFRKCYAAELSNVSNSWYLRDGDTLVSTTGIFELGFFKTDNSENKYLGIWYKKISVQTVVWVANRDRPIPAGASTPVFKIADQGTLVLLNNKSKIWSSGTTMNASRNATAKLQDSGNLVVMDQHEKVLWQSFDYPTDTQLPGMKIGKDYLRGIEWRLSSWKSSQDPAPGEFTWAADTLGYPENKIKQGALVKYRGGPWTNQRFTGVTLFNMSINYAWVAVLNNMEVSFTYIVENSSLLTYASLNSAGQLENWVWLKDAKKWQLSFSLPGSICDTYNICKAYGSCIASADMVKQSCTCLDEKRFVPRDQKGWDMDDWSGGCVRRTPLDCRNGSERFIKYSNVNLPDTESTWFNLSMSLDECETICLQNCTCMAYTYPDTSLAGRGCLIWFNDLIDIRLLPEGSAGRDIFVRMASSELGMTCVPSVPNS
uniref:G-type lectin S-receptor-like serine/threonine-protein kinase At4g27290 n=1 Tax=Erigeron canadensis TaxID=72917 RepID=UPI001CB9397F|nr:G-type lectin S-receptor-like serine/threonine-protein kinase At4g27290 [Erigeron canadensis]